MPTLEILKNIKEDTIYTVSGVNIIKSRYLQSTLPDINKSKYTIIKPQIRSYRCSLISIIGV